MEKLPGAEAKIQEYVTRIQNGEDKEFVLQGLGPAFRLPVEEELQKLESISTVEENTEPVITKTEVVSSKHIEERINADQEKITTLQEELRKELGNVKQEQSLTSEEIEKRKKLTGWTASYELAAIAEKQGIDLSNLSREEYAQYAIDNYLAIDDDQLRVQPWQRNEQSVDAIVTKARERRAAIESNTEKAFASFSYSMMELAKKDQKERYIKEGVRILSGTKDSNSWLFFSVNNGTNQNETDTYKSYFSLKDLNQFSPEQFVSFMEELQKRGYNGGVKIFQDLTEQGTRLNDQVVMHGFSESDAIMAVEVAKEFFGENIEDTSVGKDEIVEGKSKSYSQILAERIKREIKEK